MKNIFSIILILFAGISFTHAQNTPQQKISFDITVNDVGDGLCTFTTKYDAKSWEYFTKTIGNNTSILKSNIIKMFPQNILEDFDYTQDGDDRTNTIKFTVKGMMDVTNDGKWTTDLETKNPDITKISDEEYLLMSEGNAIKVHLPEGTTDSKIEKNAFGSAQLTFPAKGSTSGKILLFAGLAVAAAGIFLLFKKLRSPATQKINTIYVNEPDHKKITQPQYQEIPNQPDNTRYHPGYQNPGTAKENYGDTNPAGNAGNQ